MALRAAVSKSVHLKIYPRPVNLNESRQILRSLQQFGEVSMFKSLRFDNILTAPNNCIAIYEKADSAEKLLKASPFRFTAESDNADEAGTAAAPTQKQSPDKPGEEDNDLAPEMEDPEFDLQPGSPSKSGIDEITSASSLLYDKLDWLDRPEFPDRSPTMTRDEWTNPVEPDEPAEPEHEPAADLAPKPNTPREFHIVADFSELNHRDSIERRFWYGPYQPRKKTASYIDLRRQKAPPGIADVYANKPMLPWRIMGRFRKELSERRTMKEIYDSAT